MSRPPVSFCVCGCIILLTYGYNISQCTDCVNVYIRMLSMSVYVSRLCVLHASVHEIELGQRCISNPFSIVIKSNRSIGSLLALYGYTKHPAQLCHGFRTIFFSA